MVQPSTNPTDLDIMPTSHTELAALLKEKSDLESFSRLRWVHWLVLIGSLVITLVAYQIADKQEDLKTQERFEALAKETIELISARMEKYEDTLWTGAAAMRAHGHDLSYTEWKRFANTLKIGQRYPGVNGIGVIHRVPSTDIDQYVQYQQRLRPDFKVHPAHDKDEHWPITYIEPVKDNEAAVGLDMAHEARRLAAAKKSRASGRAQITAPITLMQDEMKTPGFLFYVPFYEGSSETLEQREANFSGLVYAPFIVSKLIKGALGEDNRQVNVSIYDDEELLYEDKTQVKNSQSHLLYTKDIKAMDSYGRNWTFHVQSNEAFQKASASNYPYIILISGLFLAIMLLVTFILLTRTNKRAIKLTDDMTKEYQNKVRALDAAMRFQNAIMDNIPDFVFVKDENLKVVQANPAFLNLYPKDVRGDVIGSTNDQFYSDEEVRMFSKNDRTALETGSSETYETVTYPNGQVRTVYTTKIRFQDPDGRNFILVISRDVTNIQEAKKALLQQKIHTDFIVSNIPYLIFDISTDGIIQDCNVFCEKVVGLPSEDIIGQNWFKLFKAPLKSTSEFTNKAMFETVSFDKEDQAINIFWHVINSDVSDADGPDFFVLIGRDMTDEKRSEEVLRQKRKMQALGHLAGGIAHELNNFLQPVLLSSEMMQYQLPADGDMAKQIEIIIRNVEASQKIVLDILKFSRQDSNETSLMPLTNNIRRAVNFSKGLLPSSLNLHVSGFEKDSKHQEAQAYINDNDLIRIISNLLSNASYAMQHKGDITVSFTQETYDEQDAESHSLKPGTYGVLSIADTGVGISRDNIELIFDPFFTTKPVGEGTGLGLTTAYGILQRWSGNIIVESKEDEGTVFTLFIPLAEEGSP